jgi:hypothetical protein
MKSRRLAFSTLLLLATSCPALAAATPEGAARITAALQAYFGSEAGVVTVTPVGETYALKIDAAPLFAKANAADFTGSLTSIEMTLADLGGGKWQVDQDQAFQFSFKIAGILDMSGKLDRYKGTGVFDETLGYFASSSATATGFTYDQVMTPPGQGTQKVHYTIGEVIFDSAFTAAGADAADGTSRYVMKGLAETFNLPADPATGMPAMDMTISMASAAQDAKIAGLRTKPLLNLVSFAVAHASQELMIKDQAAFKDLLRAAIPLFTKVEATASGEILKVMSPVGEFGSTKFAMDIGMNGVVNDGWFRERFGFEGITTPAGIVPPWAADLVPQSFAIDFDISGFDLASPAGMILDNLDLSKDPPLPKEMEQQLLSALLPQGVVKIGLGPTNIITKIAELGAKGGMTAGPMAMPAGEATVTLSGFDALLAAIQAIPPEMGAGQAIPVLMMAKGMSKPGENGALLWEIKSTPEGSVTINGVDPTKM